jgi:hypothetical protein
MFQQNALAAAALPDNGRYLIFVDREVRLVENRLFIKALGDIPEFYQWYFHNPLHQE